MAKGHNLAAIVMRGSLYWSEVLSNPEDAAKSSTQSKSRLGNESVTPSPINIMSPSVIIILDSRKKGQEKRIKNTKHGI